jgi:uncharacterized caspase-like protein
VPDVNDVTEIQARLSRAGLPRAQVRLGADGRVELGGEFENRREVQIAFSVAQSVVGVRHVAPTTPELVRYPVDGVAATLAGALSNLPRLPSQGPQVVTPSTPQRHALLVGIGEFQDPAIQRLRFTAKDARDVRDFLVSPAGGFDVANVELLLDSQATRRAIEDGLTRIESKARPGDVVLLYISSHGAPPNDRGNMNIVTWDTRARPRHEIFLTSLTDERLGRFIRAMDKVRLAVVLDTCYSGAAFAKVPEFIANGGKDLFVDEDMQEVQGISQRGLVQLATVEQPPPAGAMLLLSASSSGEKSWESEELRNSFFTYHLIAGMRRTGNLRDGYAYARPLVTDQVWRSKQANQSPQAVFLPVNTTIELKNTKY